MPRPVRANGDVFTCVLEWPEGDVLLAQQKQVADPVLIQMKLARCFRPAVNFLDAFGLV